MLKASVAVLACVSVAFGCGGGGQTEVAARSADDIAREFRAAISSKRAEAVTCDALSAYSSTPAGYFPDILEQYAKDEDLSESVAANLVALAQGIEASQFASQVATELDC